MLTCFRFRGRVLLLWSRLAPKQYRLFPCVSFFILFGKHIARLAVAGDNVNMVRAGASDLVPRELALMRSCEYSESKSQNNYTTD
jgi:hypothetical protein